MEIKNRLKFCYENFIEHPLEKVQSSLVLCFSNTNMGQNHAHNTLKMLELELRREYFDICLLYAIINDTNMVPTDRPIFRVSRFPSKHHQMLNPHTSRNDYGPHRDPIMQTKLLLNNKFSSIDIINLHREQFKKTVKEKLN